MKFDNIVFKSPSTKIVIFYYTLVINLLVPLWSVGVEHMTFCLH